MSHAKGIHHITAVAGDPQQNLDFYFGKLGLRLVKKTVNFDDPSVYHLYYGDASGNPGSILTFFPWSQLQQGEADLGQAIAISFAIPTSSVSFWSNHLDELGIKYMDGFERFGKQVIGFQDPDGLHLELIADPSADKTDGWENGPIPDAHSIRGFHGVTLAEENYQATGQLLMENLGFEEIDQEHGRILFQSESQFGSTVEIIDGADLNGRPGKGTVHHVAFRAEDKDEQLKMRQDLVDIGYHVTEVKDRQYFESVYFHEPGGVLFEVATDPPGFTADEKVNSLGQSLKLPPWLETKRGLIEADLPELHLSY